jgi:hypothetical protein
MAHAGTDRELVAVHREPRQRAHAVDVDEMRRPRQAKCHDRHQALPAGEHAPVLARDLSQGCDRFFDRLRRVILKRRGLHRASPQGRRISREQEGMITADLSHIWEIAFFLD